MPKIFSRIAKTIVPAAVCFLGASPVFFAPLARAADAEEVSVPPENKSVGAAYLKLAKELAGARNHGRVCDVDAYADTILSFLNSAVAINPELKEVIRKDASLNEAVGSTLAFRSLIGKFNETTWAGLDSALVGTEFFGPAMGVYGNISALQLESPGQGTWFTKEVLDEDPWVRMVAVPFTWTAKVSYDRVKGPSAHLTVERHGQPPEVYRVELRYDTSSAADFVLLPLQAPSDANPHYDGFSSFASECEA